MTLFLYRLIFFLFLFQSFQGFAQEIRFKHLSINDGLSQNAVAVINQDKEGFMWFGTTDGLNKYDGNKFKQYHHDPNNYNSLDHNRITSIHTDDSGNIWVGTPGGNLNRYNTSKDSFERLPLPQMGNKIPNQSDILAIASDHQGTLWVGTLKNGLFKIPITAGVSNTSITTHFKQNDLIPNGLSDNTITDIYTGDETIIWLGTNMGLNKFDTDSGKFFHYKFDIKDPKAPAHENDWAVFSIAKAEDDKLWLGTNSGLILFDPGTESYEFFPHHYTIYRYGWGGIYEIRKDKKGDLWLATTGELMQFKVAGKTYIRHRNDPFNPQSLSFNNVGSIFIDNTEQVWIGTNGLGINIYDPKSHRFSLIERKKVANSRVTGFSVRSIFKDSNRYVWIGSEVIYRLDLKTKILESFEKSSDSLNSFGNTGAWSIIKSHDNLIWFATTEGLFSYNHLSESYKHYWHKEQGIDGLPQKNVAVVYEDSSKNIWVMTENFLSKMIDKETGRFINYRYNTLSENNRYVRPLIHEIGPGNLLLGTENGLLIFNEKTAGFHYLKNIPGNATSLINNDIKSITKDPENPEAFLWIGTSGGLSKFNIKAQTFENFTIKNGMPNNVVYAVLSDHLNNLWISTNKGISKFNPNQKTFRNFDVNDGLQSNEFNTGAYFKSPKGELYFGGINGITHFFPELIKENPYIPQTAITSIWVSRKSKEDKPYINEQINPYIDEKIEFSHNDKVITFEFASLDFSAPQKNQYAYKLEGFNDTWIQNNHLTTASFTNLPPGNYTFKVKSSNNDGIWNEQAASLGFMITPHWSGTWLAYGIYASLFFLLLVFIRKYELKNFQTNNQLEYERLETETLRELDHLKTRFFTNISHEFRTPLTIIYGQTEQLIKDIQNQETKRKLKDIQQNTRRLQELINQLLDVAKLEAGKLQLHKAAIKLVPFLENLLFSYESLAKEKGLQLSFHSKEKDLCLETDREHLQKIISNILSNAIKFTPAGGKVELHLSKTKEDEISIAISDTGIGISTIDLPQVFNRFYQADYSDTRAYEGTGIGLALAKELTEALSGKLSVKNNTPQPGTTFYLSLPATIFNTVEVETPSEIMQPDLIESIINKTSVNFLPATDNLILLVEDNPQVRSFLGDQLKNNYILLEACDGQEGLELAQMYIPDLIITDVMMPVLNGYDLVKKLKSDEKTSHIPIIMLTGKATQENRIKGLETGIDAYLNKPFDSNELLLLIHNLLKKQEQLKKKFHGQSPVALDSFKETSLDRVFLEKINSHLQINFTNPDYSVEKLADQLCLSSSQLHRKLQALTGQAPGELIRNIRLKKAAELIKNNAAGVAEISFMVGFNDQAYFSRAFKKEYGCSPTAYRRDFIKS